MWGWMAGLTIVVMPIDESLTDIMKMLGMKPKTTDAPSRKVVNEDVPKEQAPKAAEAMGLL